MSAEPHRLQGEATTEQIWRDLHARVGTFVRRRLPPEADADDVVQDVFLRLSVGLREASIERPDAYVYRMARNAVIDWHRRRRPIEALVDERAIEDDPDDAVRELLAGCTRPFVESLPEPYREALVLTDLEGLSQAEAARRLGVSASGMRTRVQRGREKLRDVFEACCRFEIDRRGAVTACEPRSCGPRC